MKKLATFLTLTAVTLLAPPANAEPYVHIPIYDAFSIDDPESACSVYEDETNNDFQRDKCLCRESNNKDLRVCYPHAEDAKDDYVTVSLTIRRDGQWYALPIARADFHSHENSDHDINTWIGRKLRIVSSKAGTWRIHLRYERIFESKVRFIFEAGADIRPTQHIEAYRCTGALAVTVDVSGTKPTLKTIADESFACSLSDSDFAPDTANPHPWFHFTEINRDFQLDDHGNLTGSGLPPACFDLPRLFPLRESPNYEHFRRRE